MLKYQSLRKQNTGKTRIPYKIMGGSLRIPLKSGLVFDK